MINKELLGMPSGTRGASLFNVLGNWQNLNGVRRAGGTLSTVKVLDLTGQNHWTRTRCLVRLVPPFKPVDDLFIPAAPSSTLEIRSGQNQHDFCKSAQTI